MARRHVVLVGLPGAGKTAVGALAAARLGAPFLDVDRVIASRAGRTVPAIFAEQGEAAFRSLEAAVGAELLAGPPALVATGGGFFADPVTRRHALDAAYVVYLETTPVTAARRLAGVKDRPLLEGREPAQRLGELLEQRVAAYLEAQGRVTTDDRSAEDVAAEVAALARAHGGW